MSEIIDHLRRQLRYDRWANAEVLKALECQTAAPDRTWRLLAHIVGAQYTWLDRIHGRESRAAVWPEMTPAQIGDGLDALAGEWDDLLGQADLTHPVTYRNSKGQEWSSSVLDIVAHVANHGTYHRAQIALLLRETALEPPYTDWIHAARSGFL